jgi:ribosomal protein S18 acetylase RimI-like enzyme
LSIAGLNIRDVRHDELDEVANLTREAYLQYKDFIPEPAWKSYLEDMMDVRSRLGAAELIVAEMKDKLVGTVTLYLKANSQSGWPQDWASVRLLAVLPSYRGWGIGRALMEECVRRCRKKGITTIGLHTSELMDVARRMYEKMGFRRAPEFDFHPAPGITVMAYRLDIQGVQPAD